MQPSEAARIHDMLDSLRLLQKYVDGRARADLDADIQFQDSVVHRIEILGEAAKHVPEDIRGNCPEFPWRACSRMRDRLIHGYRNIDLDVVWEVATVHARENIPVLQRLLDAHNAENAGQ
ncbi:MAG: hypothetical protein RLZZ303_3480 [Candidatus Hydrogenedentota bacterium]|jgi:uncharacterized protein with HEPN domain